VVYFGTSDTYSLLGLDAKTGTELFKFKTNGYVFSSPAITGERLILEILLVTFLL
jgi:outer membrane protein assembly factor BamB